MSERSGFHGPRSDGFYKYCFIQYIQQPNNKLIASQILIIKYFRMKESKSRAPPSEYLSLNKFNYASKPMLPIQNLQRITILTLQISPEGKTGGVIYIQTQLGSFVLKPTLCTPSDFFFNELALTLDLNVPVATTLNCYDEQFKHIVFAIQKHVLRDETLSARLKNKLDFPFYQVIEYVPSIGLVSMGPEKFSNFINKDHLYRLYTLGMGLGFDIAINNNDRFKCVWRGEGNTNNILIQIDRNHQKLGRNWLSRSKDRNDLTVPLDNFAFIDHDGNMPDMSNELARNNVEKYLQKVTEFQLGIIMYLRKQYSSLPQQFEKLSGQMKFFTQYELSEEEKVSICEGLIYLTKKYITAFEKKEIHELYDSMIREITKEKNRNQTSYWNSFWNQEFKRRVNMNFCQLYYIKVSSIYTTYPELINQIYHKVHQEMQTWAQSRKQRKRVSYLAQRKMSIIQSQASDRHQQNEGSESLSKAHKSQSQGQQDIGNRKRKWRQKLAVFKEQNYKG